MKTIAVALLISLPAFALQEPPKPGREHEILAQLAGEWDSTSTIRQPGQEPVVSKGKETVRLIAGGLFIVFDTEADMMGMKFVGHGTLGYDVQKKKYTGSWVDSMATGVYLIEGTYDEKTKIFTETLEGADPDTGKPMKMKMVHELKDKDNRVVRFSMPGPDGKEVEGFSVEYRRRK